MALELAGEAEPWGKVPVGTVGGSHGHTGQASQRSGSTSAQDAQGTPSVDRTAQLKKRQMSVSLLVAWLGYTDAHSQLGEPRTATGWLSNVCVASYIWSSPVDWVVSATTAGVAVTAAAAAAAAAARVGLWLRLKRETTSASCIGATNGASCEERLAT